MTGVRGTSVDIQKTATGYIVNTVSSTRSDNSLKQIVGSTMLAGRTKGGTMSNISSYDTNTAMLSTNTNFASAVEITYDISTTPSVVKTTKNPDVFYGDTWIRDNATADIKYLSSLLAVISVGPLYTQLNNELDTTLITGNAPILMSLMTGTPMIADTMHINSAISILLQENNGDNKYNFNNLDCKKQKKTYFPGLAQCNGSWDTLAIMDFNKDQNMY